MIKRIPQNYVLVEVGELYQDKVILKNGSDIIVDPSYEPEKHHQVSGIVKAVPDTLYFDKTDIEFSVEYVSPIEIEEGDIVFFHYLQISNALSNDYIINKDGVVSIFVRYDQCFCVIRDNEIKMLNGWILLEPIDYKDRPNSLFNTNLPSHRQKKDPLRGKIAHIGNPVEEYFWGNEKDDDINVEEGDVVTFLPHSDIPLEYRFHQSLNNVYFRVQRKDLLNKIEYYE